MNTLDGLFRIAHAALPLLALVLALLAIVVFKGALPGLRGRQGEARVGAVLARLLPAVRHDLILPDGRGGLTQIDHLALTPAGLLVVETKNYSGTVFGGEREPTWTQTLGRQRHGFQNPLHQNYGHVQAVRALGIRVPVHGLVVFAGGAQFPQGRPEGVSRLADLATDLGPLCQGTPSAELEAAWETVLSQARTDRSARKAHLSGIQARHGGTNDGLGLKIALAGLAVLLLGVLLYPGMRPHGTDPGARTRAPASAAAPPPSHPPLTRPVRTPTDPWPADPAPTRPTRAVVVLPVVAPRPSEPPAVIEWAQPRSAGADNDDCALATAAALIENTADRQRRRERACGRNAAP